MTNNPRQESALRAVPDPEDGAAPEQDVPFPYESVFGLPPGIVTPQNFRVQYDGVKIRRVIGKEEGYVRFAFEPLVVTATFEDPEGEQFVELSWTDHSKGTRRVTSRIVSREVAKRGRELVRKVGGAGFPVTEGDSRTTERWLAEFEAANRFKIPSQALAHHLGWQPDGSFVASLDDGIKVDLIYDEQKGPARSHGRGGGFDAWKVTIKALEPYEVPRVAIAAAFAAALLRPLGISSFWLDISSRSTKGKTTALQCALSVWANPSEQADAISNWRTTLYAIEKRLNLVRGIVTVFDETMAVSEETLIDEVAYQLPMNHGKARSGGAYGSMLPWETVLLSSGERPALSFTTAQGASARILGTTKAPFGDNGGAAAVKAREGVLANYGHAGPEFVARFQEHIAEPGNFEEFKDRYGALIDKYRGSNDMTSRRAPMVAALVLAEQLACEFDVLPYEPLPDSQWRQLFSAHNPTDNRPEMAMDVVREYIAAHSHELYPRDAADDRPPLHGWLGAVKRLKGKDARQVALMPERLRGILSNAGYSLDAVLGGWLDAKYVELRDSQRPKHLIPVTFESGNKAKCIIFTLAALDPDRQDDAAA
ncbi:DUF927 domain-containing protein [Streptomyces mirabilis]|uniref:DUF927 domain-containing protein n=1 Tax=Streptomyces mirabilis TaxID=68239 RepID=UPI0033E29FA7